MQTYVIHSFHILFGHPLRVAWPNHQVGREPFKNCSKPTKLRPKYESVPSYMRVKSGGNRPDRIYSCCRVPCERLAKKTNGYGVYLNTCQRYSWTVRRRIFPWWYRPRYQSRVCPAIQKQVSQQKRPGYNDTDPMHSINLEAKERIWDPAVPGNVPKSCMINAHLYIENEPTCTYENPEWMMNMARKDMTRPNLMSLKPLYL